MSATDYCLCAKCHRKVFYDSDVTYPKGCEVKALCDECHDRHHLAVAERPIADWVARKMKDPEFRWAVEKLQKEESH